jgi:membrane fusion protein, adhesin transport system
LRLANEEMALKKPLAAKGIVPKTDVIRLQRDISDFEGQIAVLRETQPKLEAAIREAEGDVMSSATSSSRRREPSFRSSRRNSPC